MFAFGNYLQAKPYTSNMKMLNLFLQTLLEEYSEKVPIPDHWF